MTTHTSIQAERRARLKEKIQEQGLAGLLVTHAANRFYLSGFELHDPQCNESAGSLFISAEGDDFLLTDPRYEEAAAEVWPRERIVIYRGNGQELIRDFLTGMSKRVGVESRSLSMDLAAYLGGTLELVPTLGLVESLRLFKDPGEIEAMRRSCALNHRVMEAAPALLVPGRSEKDIAWDIERLFRDPAMGEGLGKASELAFPSIVAVGPNGAKPHAIPGEARVTDNCPVLIDVGGRQDHYCSDQTRTFWVGDSPTDEFQRTLDQVRTAQEKAIQVLGPGVSCSSAYHAARNYLVTQGVAERFNHGLGHGVGLETHEGPSLAPHSETILAPGMVVTVEPGLYYPEWGGVRWEYMALITEDGAELL